MKTSVHFTTTALVLGLSLAAAPALAKGHDQNNAADGDPGANVQTETVAPAKTLGGVRGNSGNTPAAINRAAPPK